MDPAVNPTPFEDGTPIGEIIGRRERERLASLETSDADLIDARDRADNGIRLALPQYAEQLGIGRTEQVSVDVVAPAEIDDALIGRVGDRVAAFRDETFRELRRLDKHAPRHLHVELLALVSQADEFLGAVTEYFRDGRS